MRVESEKKELARAVDLAMLASGRGSKDAALQNVLIKVSGNKGSIESYDNHIYSKAVFPARGESGIEFALEGTRLEHLISAAVDGNVSFDVSNDGILVNFSKASINLRAFPVDKYVRIPLTDSPKSIKKDIRAALLLQALEFARPFIGKDTQQPTRMLAELRNGRLLAGDGTRIAIVKFGLTGVQPEVAEGEEAPALQEVDFDFNLKVPQAVVSSLVRWLKTQSESEDEALVELSENTDFFILSTSRGSMFGWRKPEHEFMQIESYLDQLEGDDEGQIKFRIDKESFASMVDSLSVVLEAGAEKVTFALNGSPMTPMLTGKANDSRGIPSTNEVQVVLDGGKKEDDFSVRYSHILETLKLLKNPIVTVDVRNSMKIVQVREDAPEMSMSALLTLMAEA